MSTEPLQDLGGPSSSDADEDPPIVRDRLDFEVVEPDMAREWDEQYSISLRERKFKWGEFLSKIGGLEKIPHLPRTHSKLKNLCRQGVPEEYRPNVWFMTSGAHELLVLNSGYYTQLLETHANEEHRSAEQIEMDIPRTFPGHPRLSNLESHAKMRRILTAFAWRNPVLGYCQSMNFIVAMLLLYFEEERAFWMLCRLIEDVLPYDYYTKNMAEARVDQLVLKDLFAEKSKKLYRHMADNNILIEMVTLPWFLTAMVSQVPTETTLRIWDVMYNEGIKTVFRSALAMLKMHEKELLAVSDPVSLMSALQRLTTVTYDCDTLMHVAFNKLGSFSMRKIVKLRTRHRATVKEQIDAMVVARIQREKAAEEERKKAGTSKRRWSMKSSDGIVEIVVQEGEDEDGDGDNDVSVADSPESAQAKPEQEEGSDDEHLMIIL